MAPLPRDPNNVVVAGGLYNDGSGTIVPLPIDPSTGNLLITAVLSAASLIVGTTTTTGGTNGYALYDNNGVLGEKAFGSGTVTTVSVATANGFSGTVANATTTPAITITAGAISPISVNSVVISGSSTPTLAVTGTSSISGSNTGDQTSVSGSAGSVALSGVTGLGTGVATALAINIGTAGAVVLNSVTTLSSLVSVGTIGTGVWQGTAIAPAYMATMTATAGGAVPTPPNNTTTFLRGDGTFAAPSGSFAPSTVQATNFEGSSRFVSSGVSGITVSFTKYGMQMVASGTGQYAAYNWELSSDQGSGGSGNSAYTGSPTFTVRHTQSSAGLATYYMFCGLGAQTLATATMPFTFRHIGFKIATAGSNSALYATQADGTTENASSALTSSLAAGDVLDLCFQCQGTSSVNYYWKKNGGAWSSATNLTSNFPTYSTDLDSCASFQVSGAGSSQPSDAFLAASYAR